MATTTMQCLLTLLDDRPGSLAKATEAVGTERINIEGGFSVHAGGESTWHGLFRSEQDAAAAKVEFTRMASNTRMVIGTKDPQKVAQALEG